MTTRAIAILSVLILAHAACGTEDETEPATGPLCPPCAAPPNNRCVGTGPCGCGPYECPSTTCGSTACDTTSEYCEFTPGNGIIPTTHICAPLPASCGNAPSCDCLAAEPCGDMCTASPEGGATLECPGPG